MVMIATRGRHEATYLLKLSDSALGKGKGVKGKDGEKGGSNSKDKQYRGGKSSNGGSAPVGVFGGAQDFGSGFGSKGVSNNFSSAANASNTKTNAFAFGKGSSSSTSST